MYTSVYLSYGQHVPQGAIVKAIYASAFFGAGFGWVRGRIVTSDGIGHFGIQTWRGDVFFAPRADLRHICAFVEIPVEVSVQVPEVCDVSR